MIDGIPLIIAVACLSAAAIGSSARANLVAPGLLAHILREPVP